MCMPAIRPGSTGEYPKVCGDPAAGRKALTERLLIANATRETNAALRVVTDDGDVATITAHQESSVTYLDWRQRARQGSGTSLERLRIFDARSERSFTIEIQGTLDEEERADLRELIGRVAGSLQQFTRGNLAAAQARLQGGGLDSLDSFEVSFEHSTSVTVAEWIRRRELGSGTPAPADAPQTDAQGIKTIEGGTLGPAPVSEATEPYAESLVAAARRSTVAFEKLTRAIRQLFDKVWLENPEHGARPALAAVKAAFERLVGTTESAPEATATQQP